MMSNRKKLHEGLPFPLPAPGIDGTYSGSCIVCLRGCDTALAFVGEAEWAIAGLFRLGIPMDQAQWIVEDFCVEHHGCKRGMVPGTWITLEITVCQSCVDESGIPFPPPGVAVKGGKIPSVRQPDSSHA